MFKLNISYISKYMQHITVFYFDYCLMVAVFKDLLFISNQFLLYKMEFK